MLPRNAQYILDARLSGKKPQLPVIASFVGDLVTPCPVVYADSGKAYDWSFLAEIPTAIAVRPGIDAQHCIRELFGLMGMHYPMVFDIDRKHCFSVVRVKPRIGGMGYAWDSDYGPPATLFLGRKTCS